MRLSAWLYLMQQSGVGTLLLLCIGLSAGMPRRFPWRALALSLPLALMTMAAQTLPALLRLLMLPAAALTPLAAWPDAPRHLKLRMALLGLLMPLTLTGLLRLFASTRLPGPAVMLLGCGSLLLIARAERRAPPTAQCACIEVSVGLRRATLSALVDSGNLLRDGVTGLPVIVISRRAAARIIRLPREGTLLPGMRLMPVRTVSGTALMTILHPDALRIRTGGAWQSASAVIGLSPGGGEGFQALVPASLLPATEGEPSRRALSPQTTSHHSSGG